jgi:hypothetical protein
MSSILRIAICLILIGFASTLYAFWPYGGYCGSPYMGGVYSLSDPPYFSTNPPVYYSRVVPRPYGWSPFPYPFDSAYSPCETTSQPQIVINQYVNSGSSAATSANPSHRPLRISNPYVARADGEKAVK